MKKLFKTPEIEITNISAIDVVCTSGILGEDTGDAFSSEEDMG